MAGALTKKPPCYTSTLVFKEAGKMIARGVRLVFLVTLLVFASGCAATFSPQGWRREITRQTGAKPWTTFEFNLDESTMQFAKTVASKFAGEEVRFGGLDRIDLAVFKLPEERRLDLEKVNRRGWSKFIGTQTENSDLMILVRTNGETLSDLVVIAQGSEQLLYGRLKGRLNPGLPSTMENVLRSGGFQGLKDYLLSAAGEKKAGEKKKKQTDEPPPSEDWK